MAQVTLKGNPVQVEGELPKVGAKAADFTLTAGDLSNATLATFAGKRKVLNIFPSVDTPTCATSVQRPGQRRGQHRGAVHLHRPAIRPGTFLRLEGLENVKNLSDFRDSDFAVDYGVAIADGPLKGLTARAVVVLDETTTCCTASWSRKSLKSQTTTPPWLC